jgi:hypothetical protein
VKKNITAPADIPLTSWNLTVEKWTAASGGAQEYATETRPAGWASNIIGSAASTLLFGDATSPTYTSTEYIWPTAKTNINVGTVTDLVPWQDIPEVGEFVSGIGYYETSFNLPGGWSDANGAYLDIDSISGQTGAVYVNGEKVATINPRDCTVDISDFLSTGTNTVKVEATSILMNALRELYRPGGLYAAFTTSDRYPGWSGVATAENNLSRDFGMTGDVKIVTYSDSQTTLDGPVTFPAARGITYGQSLSSSFLTGGSNNGAFAWIDPDVKPNAGTHSIKVAFTPYNPGAYDYSSLSGWDNASKTIRRDVILEVAKASQAAPGVPVAESIGETSVKLKAEAGAEYSIDGGKTWQDSSAFDKLTPNTQYSFVIRMKADENHLVGDVSVALTVTTTRTLSILQTTVADISAKAYTGKQIKPAVTVSYNGKALAPGTDYDVAYGANVDIGGGTVSVIGKGDYTGTKAASFKIIPKKNSVKSVIVGKKSAKVYLAKASSAQNVTGYQVQYRQKGTSKWKTRTIPAKNTSVTIKKLTKGKQYQFRVRSYKTVAGARYFASWSPVKTGKKIK